MKKIFAATAFSISAVLVGVAGEISLIPQAHAEETIQAHQAVGVVKFIDKENGRVKIAHEPVPSMEWPSMTMGFGVAEEALFEQLQFGHKVKFTFVKGEDSKFVITQVTTP